MTAPRSVVADVRGPCPAREPAKLPHDWEWIGLWSYERCRFCLDRYPLDATT